MNPRFFLPGLKEPGQVVSLRGEELHHLRRVLRLRAGDEVALFDGEGRGFAGRIAGLSGSEATIVLGAEEPRERESPLDLALLPALSKGEKFDWVVQKATELGVREIQPLLTDRGDVRPAGDRGARKAERWRRIALEACKQSGRTRLPRIHEPRDLASALVLPPGTLGVALDPEGPGEETPGLEARLGGAGGVRLAVGPEGGWSPAERDLLRERGFLLLGLGPRVLRTETAAIVSTALFQFLAGDLGTGRGPGSGPGTIRHSKQRSKN